MASPAGPGWGGVAAVVLAIRFKSWWISTPAARASQGGSDGSRPATYCGNSVSHRFCGGVRPGVLADREPALAHHADSLCASAPPVAGHTAPPVAEPTG